MQRYTEIAMLCFSPSVFVPRRTKFKFRYSIHIIVGNIYNHDATDYIETTFYISGRIININVFTHKFIHSSFTKCICYAMHCGYFA